MPEEVKVTFSANDQLSKPIDNINRGLNQIDKAGQAASIGTKRASLSMTDLWSAVNLVQTGLTYLKKGYDATVGATINYANQVRQLSSLSGQSTENTSRFIQVLDDYKISAEDALLATKALTKNGHAPSIETLARLSDEYLALNNVEDRNALILKNLGKGGLQWVEVLEKGSKTLLEQGKAVNESLILGEKAVKQARVYELALDDWNDSVMALKVSIGTQLLPPLTDMLNTSDDLKRAEELATEAGVNWTWASYQQRDAFVKLAQAERENETLTLDITQALRDSTFATKDATAATQENEEAVKAMNEANQGFLGALGKVKPALETYNEGMAEAKAALAAGEITADEYADTVRGIGAAYQETKNEVILSIVEMKLAQGEWQDSELVAYLEIGKSLGVFDQQMVNTTKAVLHQADLLVGAMDEEGNAFYHAGERAIDGAEDILGFKDAQAEMGSAVRKDASPAVGGLARSFGMLPPDGTEWNYHFNITKSGSIPAMPKGTPHSDTSGGVIQADYLLANNAKGGPLGSGWTLVGDAPGGRPTQYSELISPSGYVLDAKTTRAILASGALDDFQSMASGSGEQLTSYRSATSIRSGLTTKRRSSSGSRGTIDKFYSGGSGGSSGGSLAEEAAVTAAEVAEEATTVAASSLVAAESISNNVQQGSQASVAATVSTSGEIIAAIQETNHLLRRLDRTTHDSQYEQQLNI